MIVAVDDSGDPGFKFNRGSSKYFCIAAVYFEDDIDAEKMKASIDEIKFSLGFKKGGELKYSKADKKTKKIFFKEILKKNFKISVKIVDKTKVRDRRLQRKPDLFYNTTILEAIKDIESKDRLTVIIDGKKGKSYRQTARTFFRKNMPKGAIEEISYIDSRKENLIQLADMIVGALREDAEGTSVEVVRWLRKRI